jgi:hypothetical protein
VRVILKALPRACVRRMYHDCLYCVICLASLPPMHHRLERGVALAGCALACAICPLSLFWGEDSLVRLLSARAPSAQYHMDRLAALAPRPRPEPRGH